MSELSDLIEIIGQKDKVNICIHDVSGILSCGKLLIDFANKTHTSEYCRTAKSTQKGYNLCIKCKKRANEKAINTQIPFLGFCPFGVFEAVCPVVVENHILAVVYVGSGALRSSERSLRIEKTCRALKLGSKEQEFFLNERRGETNQQILIKTANVIANYIKLITEENGYLRQVKRNSCVWAVESICEYTENNFQNKLTLKNLAKLYFMNEKYLGRLFKRETGKSFNKYLNEIRLSKACEMLYSTDKSIIEIALDCGYSSVNYFNRLCFEKYQMSPSKLRKVKKP